MKKLLLGLVIILGILFAYEYQFPLLSTDEAIDRAAHHLQHPPEEFAASLSPSQWEDVPSDMIQTTLQPSHHFWGRLTHRMTWEVTMKQNGQTPTVVLDAYTGKLLDIYGPVN